MEKIDVIEHIRKRPGMYIGSLDHAGFNELIHYLIQDLIATETFEITFILKENNQLIIEGLNEKTFDFISKAVEDINDYNGENFHLSIATLIGLSDYLKIEFDDCVVLNSNKGIFKIENEILKAKKIKFDFTIDKDIFKNLVVDYISINHLLKRFSYLNSKLRIKSIDKSGIEKQTNIFHFSNGLSEKIDFELRARMLNNDLIFRLNFDKETEYSYSLALAFVRGFWMEPKLKVYSNYKESALGGSLLDGILQGMKLFFKRQSRKKNLNMSITNAKLKNHLILFASVTGELNYLGATRAKLGTPKVQLEIKEFVYLELQSYFSDKEDELKDIIDVLQNNY